MKSNSALFIINFLFIISFISCSGKPDISGKWVGSSTEVTRRGNTKTSNFEIVLSQSEKNIQGTLTLNLKGEPGSTTINIEGFIEEKTVSFNGELVSMMGGSMQIVYKGTITGDEIVGKVSFPGLMAGKSLDLILERM